MSMVEEYMSSSAQSEIHSQQRYQQLVDRHQNAESSKKREKIGDNGISVKKVENYVKMLTNPNDEEIVEHAIGRLECVQITLELLTDTMVGKAIARLSGHPRFGDRAKRLVSRWKADVSSQARARGIPIVNSANGKTGGSCCDREPTALDNAGGLTSRHHPSIQHRSPEPSSAMPTNVKPSSCLNNESGRTNKDVIALSEDHRQHKHKHRKAVDNANTKKHDRCRDSTNGDDKRAIKEATKNGRSNVSSSDRCMSFAEALASTMMPTAVDCGTSSSDNGDDTRSELTGDRHMHRLPSSKMHNSSPAKNAFLPLLSSASARRNGNNNKNATSTVTTDALAASVRAALAAEDEFYSIGSQCVRSDAGGGERSYYLNGNNSNNKNEVVSALFSNEHHHVRTQQQRVGIDDADLCGRRKTGRMRVYAGRRRKNAMSGDPNSNAITGTANDAMLAGLLQNPSSLYTICERVCTYNIDAALDFVFPWYVPFDLLSPVLEKCSHAQLNRIEQKNPYLREDTGELWRRHCAREFPDQYDPELVEGFAQNDFDGDSSNNDDSRKSDMELSGLSSDRSSARFPSAASEDDSNDDEFSAARVRKRMKRLRKEEKIERNNSKQKNRKKLSVGGVGMIGGRAGMTQVGLETWRQQFTRLTAERERRLAELAIRIQSRTVDAAKQAQRLTKVTDAIAPRDARRRQLRYTTADKLQMFNDNDAGHLNGSSSASIFNKINNNQQPSQRVLLFEREHRAIPLPSAAELSRSRRQIFETGNTTALHRLPRSLWSNTGSSLENGSSRGNLFWGGGSRGRSSDGCSTSLSTSSSSATQQQRKTGPMMVKLLRDLKRKRYK